VYIAALVCHPAKALLLLLLIMMMMMRRRRWRTVIIYRMISVLMVV